MRETETSASPLQKTTTTAVSARTHREGVTFETLASASNPRVSLGFAPRETITLWSRRAVRQLQRQFPPERRLTEQQLVRMTAALPAGGDRPRAPPPPAVMGGEGEAGGGRGVGGGGKEEKTGRAGGGGGGGYCGEAFGARRLGGVADPDVDALLRSSQPLRKR